MNFSPPTILIWGGSGIGKTSAVLTALGARCAWLTAERGALSPASHLLGPAIVKKIVAEEILAVDDPVSICCQKLYGSIFPLVEKGQIDAIAIDTLSTLADRQLSWIYRTRHDADKYAKGYRLLLDQVGYMINLCLTRNVSVLALAHEGEPQTIEGKYRPRGPRLPGKLIEWCPAQFDVVLRMAVEPGQNGPKRVFRRNELDRTMLTKDRFNVTVDGEEVNLSALLGRIRDRVAGRAVKLAEAPKPAGLDFLGGEVKTNGTKPQASADGQTQGESPFLAE